MTLDKELIIVKCFELKFGDLERPRSSGSDLENALCGYNFTMKMNSNDKIVCGNNPNKQNIQVLKRS